MDASDFNAESADRDLKLATAEISKLFEALWRAARDLEAYNGDFVSLLHDEARLGASAQGSYGPVIDIWTVTLKVIEEVIEERNAHLMRKDACMGCVQKRWCHCTSAPPDFHSYQLRIRNAFETAEVRYVMESQGVPLEGAKVLVALNPQYQIASLPPQPNY
jgi:hypothetical protein